MSLMQDEDVELLQQKVNVLGQIVEAMLEHGEDLYTEAQTEQLNELLESLYELNS